jgi:hypothetical protein
VRQLLLFMRQDAPNSTPMAMPALAPPDRAEPLSSCADPRSGASALGKVGSNTTSGGLGVPLSLEGRPSAGLRAAGAGGGMPGLGSGGGDRLLQSCRIPSKYCQIQLDVR